MFFIMGVSNKTKEYHQKVYNCGRCNNTVEFSYVRLRKYFTLFFIPLIPISTKYLLVCPICSANMELTKDKFFSSFEEVK